MSYTEDFFLGKS